MIGKLILAALLLSPGVASAQQIKSFPLTLGNSPGTVARGDDPRIVNALSPTMPVMAQGGTTVNTGLSAFLGRFLTARDMNAKGTGIADDGPAMQALPTAKQAMGGLVYVTPGTYQMANNVYTPGNVAWMFERGTTLTGQGQIDAVVDPSVLAQAAMTMGRLLSAQSNEFGYSVQMREGVSNGNTSTEKTAFIASMNQSEPSNYTTGVLHDLVGFDAQGNIDPTVHTGRIYGYEGGVGTLPGGDGVVMGAEFAVGSQSGSDAGPFGSPTMKVGIQAVAQQTNNITAAYSTAQSGGAHFLDGYVANIASMVPGAHAYAVRPYSQPGAYKTRNDDVAWIDTNGNALFANVAVGNINSVGSWSGASINAAGNVAGAAGTFARFDQAPSISASHGGAYTPTAHVQEWNAAGQMRAAIQEDGTVVASALAVGGATVSSTVQAGQTITQVSTTGHFNVPAPTASLGGSIGAERTRVLVGTTAAANGGMELTSDGLPVTANNTLSVPANTTMLITGVRFVAFDAGDAWSASYSMADILASKAATNTTLALSPASPTLVFQQQLGTAPAGGVAFGITTDTNMGRIAVSVATGIAKPMQYVAVIKTLEVGSVQ